MARLAELLYCTPAAAGRPEALSREALALAEDLGDAGTLGYALIARHYGNGPPRFGAWDSAK